MTTTPREEIVLEIEKLLARTDKDWLCANLYSRAQIIARSLHQAGGEHGYSGDVAQLQRNLASRDEFLVDRGLFSAYVDWLPSVSVERERAYPHGTRAVVNPEFTAEKFQRIDTPQSVPACTCSKHPLWDGYDGDCPIHGWFEPVTPNAPLSQGEGELAKNLQEEGVNVYAYLDLLRKRIASFIAERDKLIASKAWLKEQFEISLASRCKEQEERDKLVERVSVLEALLLKVYNESGPRDGRCKVIPPEDYASLSAEEVNENWDFEGRFFMHSIALALTRTSEDAG